MQRWRSQLAAGIVLALLLTPHAVATAAEDISGLIAELSQAWQQGRSKDFADRFDEARQLAPRTTGSTKPMGIFSPRIAGTWRP